MKSRRWAFASLVVGTVTTLAALAIAHDTPNTRRTPAQCASLPPGDRGACLACVNRPRPHHFHPLEAGGTRCDPSDGVRR